jgi:ribosomal protein L4
MVFIDDKLGYLMCEEYRYKEKKKLIHPIGGKVETFDNDILETAIREFIEETNFEQFTTIKTKMVLDLITKLGLNLQTKILFVLTKPNRSFWLASRNLKNVEVTSADCLNLKQLLQTSSIIISNNSLKLINTKYGK